MNRMVTVLIVLAVAGVGAFAAIDGLGSDSTTAGEEPAREESASRDLIGPHSPEPGALPGTLVVARGEKCVIQLVDLTRLRFSKAGPESGCDFNVSPDGSLAAVAAAGAEQDASPLRYEVVSLEERPKTQTGLGTLQSQPAWSHDGVRLAACAAAVSSQTTVVRTDGAPRETVSGCWPAFDTDGGLVTRTVTDLTAELPSDGISVDGEERLSLPELFGAAEGAIEEEGFVLCHTTGPGAIIVVSLAHAVAGGDARGSLQLWRDRATTAVSEIPLFLEEGGIPPATTESWRDALSLSPDGREVGIVLEDGAEHFWSST